MTYEESVNQLIEVAGDYNSIVANHALENSVYNATVKNLFEELKKCMSSLSVGDCNIDVSDTGFLVMRSNKWNIETVRLSTSVYATVKGQAPLTALKSLVRKLAFEVIRRLSVEGSMALPDISRFASYANMVETSIDEALVEKIAKIAKEGSDATEALAQENTNYSKYVKNVNRMLSSVALDWFKEMPFTPGMKIAVVNAKTGSVSARTIKKITEKDGKLRITTKESSTIITNTDHIDISATWFLNAGKYADIARAVKWKYAEQFI